MLTEILCVQGSADPGPGFSFFFKLLFITYKDLDNFLLH